jgi:hypothetical protein
MAPSPIGEPEAVSDVAFGEALRHHEAGRIGEARAIYQSILAEDAGHADSLHLLGLITAQEGNPASGAELIRRAIARAP